MARQQTMLSEFREVFEASIAPMVRAQLVKPTRSIAGRAWNWIHAPLLFTLERRKNLFRGVFALRASAFGPHPEAGPSLAGCVEIAWCCALILDDIFDRSAEREGHPAAHRIYGAPRCFLATLWALAVVYGRLGLSVPGSLRVRGERLWLSLVSWLACCSTQLPGRKLRSLDDFRRDARRVNNSHRWALLAPLAGRRNAELNEALSLYADHMAIAGKMRNDLLDYSGGSSEREGRFEDFEKRCVTFPVLVLLSLDLAEADRLSLENHFAGKGGLSQDGLLGLLHYYGVAKVCLDHIHRELSVARSALARASDAGAPASMVELLQRWTYLVSDVCRERLQLVCHEQSHAD